MVKFLHILFCLLILSAACAQNDSLPELLVLGVAQDGGFPHIGCERNCCNLANQHDSIKRLVVSLALTDPVSKKWWMFEASPDFVEQLQLFKELTNGKYPYLPEGIFLSHAHMGHYTGLMELGREALGSKNVKVHALPKMREFLTSNGPWSQLVSLGNIQLVPESFDSIQQLNERISVKPLQVPHRDEFSETAGFKILTSNKDYLFIPDIDKWSKWDLKLAEQIEAVDYAFIDATFWSITELPFRNIKSIPHPLVTETMDELKAEPASLKSKVFFIHFNHTNKIMWDPKTQIEVKSLGYNYAIQGISY
ncbi:MAG: pyrroloquinoline quinone biosynthesis protein B [Parvicellaceae bacterium]